MSHPPPRRTPRAQWIEREKYIEAFERLTGVTFARYLDRPESVLCD